MLSKIFGRPKKKKPDTTIQTIAELEDTLKMLEKKEGVLLNKSSEEVTKAKQYSKDKNKRAAILCLKRKRLYEQQVEQLGKFQMRIYDQITMLENANATTETIGALKTGATAMQAMHKKMNINDVDKTMEEINEQTENMRQIQQALSQPVGGADFDEDELEAELADLEGNLLEEQLTAVVSPEKTMYVPSVRQPLGQASKMSTTEEDELAALQAELAI